MLDKKGNCCCCEYFGVNVFFGVVVNYIEGKGS